MEVVLQVLLVDKLKMTLAVEIVGRLVPEDVTEMGGVADLGGAQKTMVEKIVEGGLLRILGTHKLVVSIAGDDGVGALELKEGIVERIAPVEETKGDTSLGIERIELGKGAVLHDDDSAIDKEAVAKGVGELTVEEAGIGVIEGEAGALAVMDDTALHIETMPGGVDSGGVADDGRGGITDLGVKELVAEGGTSEGYAAPLAADSVVGQIGEHMVETVATHKDAIGDEGSLDLDAALVVEEELGVLDAKGHAGSYLHGAVDDQRPGETEGAVAGEEGIADELGIPGEAAKGHGLLHPTLELEHKVVADLLGHVAHVALGGELDEDADAVVTANLKVANDGAGGVVEIGAVDIDAEARLVAVAEVGLGDADAVVVVVIGPEGIGGRADGGEYGVEADGIDREGEERRGAGGERVVVTTACQRQKEYGEEKENPLHLIDKTDFRTFYCISVVFQAFISS